MLSQSRDVIEKHKRTHTERSAEDVAAISTIEFFFRSDGKINTNFAKTTNGLTLMARLSLYLIQT